MYDNWKLPAFIQILSLNFLYFIRAVHCEAPLPERNYLPPSTSYGTPDLGNVGSNEVSSPSASYGAPSTSYDPPPAGKVTLIYILKI